MRLRNDILQSAWCETKGLQIGPLRFVMTRAYHATASSKDGTHASIGFHRLSSNLLRAIGKGRTCNVLGQVKQCISILSMSCFCPCPTFGWPTCSREHKVAVRV